MSEEKKLISEYLKEYSDKKMEKHKKEGKLIPTNATEVLQLEALTTLMDAFQLEALTTLMDAFTEEITTAIGNGLTIQGHRRIVKVLGLEEEKEERGTTID